MSFPAVALRPITTAVLTAITLVIPKLGGAQAMAPQPEPDSTPRLQSPEVLQVEHQEIHHALELATLAPGNVGAAARELVALLQPHFAREEAIALPPLGLLAPLARGEYTPAMLAVLPLTDSLHEELPQMLQEHAAILAATLRLQAAAQAAGAATAERLAEALALHAQNEEEILYPAALLVGEVVRVRSQRSGK